LPAFFSMPAFFSLPALSSMCCTRHDVVKITVYCCRNTYAHPPHAFQDLGGRKTHTHTRTHTHTHTHTHTYILTFFSFYILLTFASIIALLRMPSHLTGKCWTSQTRKERERSNLIRSGWRL
jgi:hypothetical protein